MIERDGSVMRVSGPLTIASVGALADAGRQQFGDGPELIVDFGGATDVDSAALSIMFEWQREARRRNMRISFRSLPANLESLATLYGVSELMAATAGDARA